MANIKSQKKRIITNRKSALLNNDVKQSMRTAIKKFEKAIKEDVENVNDKFNIAIKAIDKAASKGVIKKKTDARYKSKLSSKLKQVTTK